MLKERSEGYFKNIKRFPMSAAVLFRYFDIKIKVYISVIYNSIRLLSEFLTKGIQYDILLLTFPSSN